MERRIIFATNNEDKMNEIQMILANLHIPVYSMKQVGIDMDIVEDGSTFEDNAMIKARAIAKLMPTDIILADDSGLEIEYLDNAPGIYSARFAGENASYDFKNNLLLDKLQGVPDEQRTARFVCVIAAIFPDGSTETVRGIMEGRISHEIIGEQGFGYDPIFYIPEYGCTTAQMDPVQKNELSHRGKALRAISEMIEKKVKDEDTNCQ